MKAIKSLVSTAAALAAALTVVPSAAFAADDVVYGTMEIPYADFYAAELAAPYAVDAVTSATTSKWAANQEGGLVQGTYNDGAGKILGVVYPVAIAQADLDALGENNYNFTKLDAAPAAYKNVTVSGSDVTFSAVQGVHETFTSDITFTANSRYGDYQIDIASYPDEMVPAYGVIVKTADGSTYAMRALENIWRRGTSIAWTAGITTKEGHGNELSVQNYAETMGKTVTEMIYITADGYHTLSLNQYLPVKFANTVSVESSKSGTGSTTFTTEGFPEDYQQTYAIADGFTAADGKISYTDAAPGRYTLTISDGSGKYADVTSSFLLTTDALPVKYEDGKLVAADGYTDADAAAFIRAISSVDVDGTTYNTGRRGTTIVQTADDAFGVIDFAVQSGDNAVFANGANGEYVITVNATAYTTPLVIRTAAQAVTTEQQPGTTATAANTTTKATTKAAATTTAKAAGGASTTAAAAKTGDAGVGAIVAALLLAGAAAFLAKKKH